MMPQPLRWLFQKVNRAYSVRANVRVGRRVHIGAGTTLWAPKRLTVGDDTYIGKRCTIECDGSIGAGVLIANHVGIVGRFDHDFSQVGTMVRMAPWIGEADFSPDLRAKSRVVIGDDVWLGYGVLVLSGITVGRGAVVAAGSVVTHDVEPYSIVAGNPARHVKWRFTPEEVQEHERLLRQRHTR